jgi:hypothetical protein
MRRREVERPFVIAGNEILKFILKGMTLLLECLTYEEGPMCYPEISDNNYEHMLGKSHVGEGLKLRICTDRSF